MVLLGLVLGVVLIVWGLQQRREFLLIAMVSIGILISFVSVVCGCTYLGDIAESRVIDGKIAIYQEENEGIEKDIESVVKQYMEHEKEVFELADIDSPSALVQLYPELKSDKLVKQQLEVYHSNNKEIKDLKEKKLDCEKSKWLLYFGGIGNE